MQEFERDQDPGAEPDPRRADRMADLTMAADQLREAISALTQAVLRGSPLEKANARDRFDLALAAYSSLIEETRE